MKPTCDHIVLSDYPTHHRTEIYLTLLNTKKIAYDQTFDSFYCVECGAWVEPKCGDRNCHYCKDRLATNFAFKRTAVSEQEARAP